MPTQNASRTVIYARDMSEDGPEQVNLDGNERPDNLKDLMSEAATSPRPFDAVVVASMPVFGNPSQAKTVVEELTELGVQVMTTDGSTT